MRTLAIGDIHGCREALESLWDFVGISESDQVITLGDYVDRGPDSKGVVDFLIEKQGEANLICLRGNHEAAMLEALMDRSAMMRWSGPCFGGEATLESYGAKSFVDIPDTHWKFLREARRYHETESHVFVHANLAPDVPLIEQDDLSLLWSFFDNPQPHQSGKVMVCGHSTQESGLPKSVGHAVCIDTDVCHGGWLTCLDVESGHYWQTSEEGEQRKGEL